MDDLTETDSLRFRRDGRERPQWKPFVEGVGGRLVGWIRCLPSLPRSHPAPGGQEIGCLGRRCAAGRGRCSEVQVRSLETTDLLGEALDQGKQLESQKQARICQWQHGHPGDTATTRLAMAAVCPSR